MTKKRSFEFQHTLLHARGGDVPHLVRAVRGVQQEGGTGRGEAQHVDLFQERWLVAGDKAGALDQVGRVDRVRAETQMRNGLGARFVQIVDEITLRVQAGVLGDDLHAVLVGAHGAIGAQSVEHGLHHIRRIDAEGRDRPPGWCG